MIPNLIDVCDVRMIKRRRRFRFLNETTHPVLVGSKGSWQNLQCDFAIEFGILRQIYFAHPASADLRDDAVM